MKLTTVFGILPAIVLYNVKLPDGVIGSARLFVAMIGDGFENDESVLRHELKHVEQFYVCTLVGLLACVAILGMVDLLVMPYLTAMMLSVFVYPVGYKFSRMFRAEAEGSAYSEQMRYLDKDGNRMTQEQAAEHLAGSQYNLKLSTDQASNYIGK